MKNTQQPTQSAPTETKELATKALPISIETLENKWQFKTFGEDDLCRMLTAANQMCNDIASCQRPYWLSFVGKSGSGKTYLAKQIKRAAQSLLPHHPELIYPVEFVSWAKLLDRLRDGEYYRIRDIEDANFIVLDDIGTEGDKTGFALEKLYRCIVAREEKWMVLTSNLDLEEIADQLDTRISSRLIRDRNVTVHIQTQDYALRPK